MNSVMGFPEGFLEEVVFKEDSEGHGGVDGQWRGKKSWMPTSGRPALGLGGPADWSPREEEEEGGEEGRGLRQIAQCIE